MSKKNISRLRRARKTRSKVKLKDIHRLTVFRSSMHIYAQVMLNDGSEVVTSASSNESEVKGPNNGNIDTASKVGRLIAERALEKGIKQVAWKSKGLSHGC